MGVITKPKTWADNEKLLYTDLNSTVDTVYNEFNGNIENANVKSGAAIDVSKISGTAVNLSSTQTISGQKTIVKPIMNGSLQALTADSDSATITFDMTASNIHSVTLGGNRTLAVSNVSVGQPFMVRLKQDATGSRTVTWWSGINWVGGSAPTLTTTISKTDVFGFLCTATDVYDGYIVGQNI